MNKPLTKETTVGAIVADDFNKAKVFEHVGIDYCCHGDMTLEEACKSKDYDVADIISRLEREDEQGGAPHFAEWPLDLLLDYVLKKHHRNFHLHHEEMMRLVEKVANAHGDRHPELHEIRKQVAASLEELNSHFAKEEQVLFPQMYELFEAYNDGRNPAPFHCGSILHPIRQMMLEHDTAGDMWQHIAELAEDFTTPDDGCASYRLMNRVLRQFFQDLKEHITIENQLLFPGFLRLEQEPA